MIMVLLCPLVDFYIACDHGMHGVQLQSYSPQPAKFCGSSARMLVRHAIVAGCVLGQQCAWHGTRPVRALYCIEKVSTLAQQ